MQAVSDVALSPDRGRIAYFSMEFAFVQALKTYSGGLGFLAGSHMRSAWALGQPLVAIGILWKYGYYDQARKPDQTMDVLFMEKHYSFLQPPICAFDAENLYQLLEMVILPLYYDRPAEWMAILKASVREVQPTFDSDRMATEYMEKLYMIGPA